MIQAHCRGYLTRRHSVAVRALKLSRTNRDAVAQSLENAKRAAATEKALIVRNAVSDRQNLHILAQEKAELERELQAVRNRLEDDDAMALEVTEYIKEWKCKASWCGWKSMVTAILRRSRHRQHLALQSKFLMRRHGRSVKAIVSLHEAEKSEHVAATQAAADKKLKKFVRQSEKTIQYYREAATSSSSGSSAASDSEDEKSPSVDIYTAADDCIESPDPAQLKSQYDLGRPSVQDLDGNTIFDLDSSGSTHRQSVRLLSADLQFAAAILIQRVFRHWQHAQATDNDTPWSGTSVVALQYLMFLTHVMVNVEDASGG